MSTIEEQRIQRAKEHLLACEGYLQRLVPEWNGLTPFMKDNMIGSAATLIDLCDCFTVITQVWVEDIFHENGGWPLDHEFTTGVIKRLRQWRSLTA
jgi:hypothetical protein